MEFATIKAVIDRYGFYTAEKEREYIRSHQRTPETALPSSPREGTMTGKVADYLSRVDGWRSIDEIVAATGLPRERAMMAVNSLVYHRHAERQSKAIRGQAILRGAVQRYRWVR